MEHQGVTIAVWLGIALLALIWAQLALWRTRHTLKKLRQDLRVPDGRLVPVAYVEPAVAVADAGLAVAVVSP